MSHSRYKIVENGQAHFLTCTVNDWIPIFDNDEFKMIIIESLNFLIESNRLVIYAYVVMKHHIHFIASSDNLVNEISAFKSFTARSCIGKKIEQGKTDTLNRLKLSDEQSNNRSYKFWIEGTHPELIQGYDMMSQKVKYIHENPVRAEYVKNPQDWIYSSFLSYHGKSGLINIKTDW